jgi:cyclopropane-fatty-acyl-phospholipid synthase
MTNPLTSTSMQESNDHAAQAMPAQAKLILQLLKKIKHGSLRLECPDHTVLHYGDQSQPVTLSFKNWQPCIAAVKSGDIGFAESYIQGDWTTDNLPRLLEFFIHNRQAVEAAIYGTWWGSLLYRIKHIFNRNSRSGSRRNIHAHYDIGNHFYRLWLDPSMTYSSALFKEEQYSLEQAQQAKYARIYSQIDGHAGSKILEIGCGWGGFAECATKLGAHVTGLTLSTEQLEFARARLADAGLDQHADLRLQDYRDTEGEFDAIASIEMFEAVGENYWDSYFSCVAQRLKTGGKACIQTITIADELFERYRKGTDFIQQYIFPGGMLPSPTVFRARAEKHGLDVVDECAFGLDYARTLSIWDQSFQAKKAEIFALGFDERFKRTWEFYLAYCEAGFRAKSIDLFQFTLQKK